MSSKINIKAVTRASHPIVSLFFAIEAQVLHPTWCGDKWLDLSN